MTPNDRTAPGVCLACNGAGQQPYSQPECYLCTDCPPVGYPTDETRCLPCPRRTGQRPAQPDYDPIAAVEAVDHYEASAKALDALDAQPGSGEVMQVIGYKHEITEPDGQHSVMFSAAPGNPWSKWVAEHRERCQYTCTPLVAASALTAAQRDRNAQYDRAQKVSEHNSRLWSEREALRGQLTAAQQRIAELERENADLRTRLNHSERLQGRYPRDAV